MIYDIYKEFSSINTCKFLGTNRIPSIVVNKKDLIIIYYQYLL